MMRKEHADISDMEVAIAAASAGSAVVRAAFGRRVEVEIKPDHSPVTAIDREAERVIETEIAAHRPNDGFFGEESGRSDGPSGRLWVVDPLDGTKNFLRRLPFCSVQVALFAEGDFQVGASAAPSFDETAAAANGNGAFLNGERIHVSSVDRIEAASLSFGNLKTLARGRGWARLGDLVRRADRTRGYGDFFHYHALAAGKLDVVIESDVSIYDVAALAVIVREAGGRVTDLNGGPLSLSSTSIVATNGFLHDAVLEALAS